MKVFELLGKLNRVNRDNKIWIKQSREKCEVGFNVDDIGDVDMYVINKNDKEFRVKDLLKFLKQVDPNKNVFLAGKEGVSYYFSGVKYDSKANVLLYIRKGDMAA